MCCFRLVKKTKRKKQNIYIYNANNFHAKQTQCHKSSQCRVWIYFKHLSSILKNQIFTLDICKMWDACKMFLLFSKSSILKHKFGWIRFFFFYNFDQNTEWLRERYYIKSNPLHYGKKNLRHKKPLMSLNCLFHGSY